MDSTNVHHQIAEHDTSESTASCWSRRIYMPADGQAGEGLYNVKFM